MNRAYGSLFLTFFLQRDWSPLLQDRVEATPLIFTFWYVSWHWRRRDGNATISP